MVSAGGKLFSPVSKLSVAVLHLAVSRLLMAHIPQLIITFAWFPELLLHVFGECRLHTVLLIAYQRGIHFAASRCP